MDYKEEMHFLAKLYHEDNYNHEVITVARSAISAILSRNNGLTSGQHPTVFQMMKGIFKLRPLLPNYNVTYYHDVMFTLPILAHYLAIKTSSS